MIRCTARNSEVVDIRTVSRPLSEADVSAKLAGSARATGVSVGDDGITLCLETDVVVEMSALTRMWVKAYDMCDDVLSDLDDPDDDSSSSGSSSDSSLGE